MKTADRAREGPPQQPGKQAEQPLLLRAGILSTREYGRLTRHQRSTLEADVQRLAARHGEDWLRRERDRVRDEIEFRYGLEFSE